MIKMLGQHTTCRLFLIMDIIRKCDLAVDKLLHRKSEKRYRTAALPIELVNKFADFFNNKIATIRKQLIIYPSHYHTSQQQK